MRPVEESCFWLATRPRRPYEALSGEVEADVAIVGGGYTGLWTALFLKELEPAISVAVLEAEIVGYGGSGRNAGIAGETLDHSHELAIAHFGLEEARELARLGRENLDEMEVFLRERRIDAEMSRPGQLVFALTPAHVKELSRALEAAQRLGVTDWKLLSGEEAQEEIRSELYLGALLAPRSALVHPSKLVAGLAAEAERLGVRIFERSGVRGFDLSRGRVDARTDRGRVSARKLVLATNAYTHLLWPGLRSRFLPLYDYVFVSEPLTEEQWQGIGWKRRCGATDSRPFFNYYRPTSDGRILWGTSEAVYYRGRVDPSLDHSPASYAALETSFHRHFPQLQDLRFPYAWGGAIAATTRLTPFFGTARGGRIAYGLGYTGHGVGTTRLAGKILAHLALEKHSPLLELSMVRKKPLPYPPEPIRSLAVAVVTRALHQADARGRPGLLLRALQALGIGFSS